jgi:hypothetical protein
MEDVALKLSWPEGHPGVLFTTLGSSMEESKEGLRAFVEKRDPSWVTALKSAR